MYRLVINDSIENLGLGGKQLLFTMRRHRVIKDKKNRWRKQQLTAKSKADLILDDL